MKTFIVLISFILFACMTQYKLVNKKETDPMFPDKQHWFSKPISSSKEFLSETYINIYAHRILTPNYDIKWLEIVYFSADWIFIENIILKIGDKKWEFDIDEVNREVLYGGNIYEEITIDLSDDILGAIKNHTEMNKKESIMIVRINGQHYYYNGLFEAKDLLAIKYFYEQAK